MKTTINHILGKAWLGLAALALPLASCSDWDDHYNPSTADGGSKTTLWQAISSESNLSNFAQVLKGCGYDRNLSGSQTYTVFALTNDGLTSAQADSLVASYQTQKANGVRDDDNTVIHQFIKNHISMFTQPVSSLTNDTLTMLNGKIEPVTLSAIGSQKFVTSNALHSNGLLFTIGGQLNYFPNVFEYLGIDSRIDSAYNFINSYSTYEFNENASVAGGINENGQTVYLDSVMTLTNSLFQALGQINSEDSTYWMLVPTNDQWTRMVGEYHDYFDYANTVNKRDSMQEANTRLAILEGMVFSRTINPDAAFADSAVSTHAQSYTYRKAYDLEPYNIFYRPFDAGGIFDGTEDVECSNGHVRVAPNFNVPKEKTFFQTVKVEAENVSRQDTLIDASQPLTVHEVSTDNPFYDKISGNSFVDVIAENTTTNPNHFPVAAVQYSIPNLLSNVGYDIYVVFAPQHAYNQYIPDDDLLPNRFRCMLYYSNKDNKQLSKRLDLLTNDPTKVDTVKVASNFTFPTCSYGLSTPNVKLRIMSQVSQSQTSTYATDFHIDCIIFKPHEN